MSEQTDGSRTVVVTGAGAGIGRACARRLAGPATFVVALDRDESAAAAICRELQMADGAGKAVGCDITDPAAVRAAVADLPRVDVLVNSAGIDSQRALTEITAVDMRTTYEVNVIGLLQVVQAALPRMPVGARIINIGSRAYLGSANHAHYVASKAAVVGLTRTLVLELSDRQISVNAVAPGPVRTRLLLDELSEARLAQAAAAYPGGRLPEPDDVAQVVAFLADPATRHINGQVIILDGGRSVGLTPA